ncbi:hypothetical protein DIPPA_32423 [Diplonema papillatum]|nr:hypothetical protein DIPPA_32423 [Diplonema papillatum]
MDLAELITKRKSFHATGTIRQKWEGAEFEEEAVATEGPKEHAGPESKPLAPDLQELAAVADGTDAEPKASKPLWEVLQEQKERQVMEEEESFRNQAPRGMDAEDFEYQRQVELDKERQERERARQDTKQKQIFEEEIRMKIEADAKENAAQRLSRRDFSVVAEDEAAEPLQVTKKKKRKRKESAGFVDY